MHDVVADGIVGKLDLDEVRLPGRTRTPTTHTCGALLDPAADVNGDGCVDVVDLQAVMAAKGERFAGIALEPTSDTFALLGSDELRLARARMLPAGQRTLRDTITVNTTADTVDVKADDGVCADSHGRCSLRAAITTANWAPGREHDRVQPHRARRRSSSRWIRHSRRS